MSRYTDVLRRSRSLPISLPTRARWPVCPELDKRIEEARAALPADNCKPIFVEDQPTTFIRFGDFGEEELPTG